MQHESSVDSTELLAVWTSWVHLIGASCFSLIIAFLNIVWRFGTSPGISSENGGGRVLPATGLRVMPLMVRAHLDIFIIGFFEDADDDTSTNAVNAASSVVEYVCSIPYARILMA